ncbi:Filamin-C [Liparis tanakae]|uniref:Filamin-C n=1 Tax=Liparis tanakae TaxID=230148 RepID=A0A4Z2E106_9TELE|nr:Filamin-C [Liparis tanakae]
MSSVGAGTGEVAVAVRDPQGRPLPVDVAPEADSTYRCSYRAAQAGPHAVAVTFGGAPIPRSPFAVDVGPACVPGACRASGRGLQPAGLRLQQLGDVKVDARAAGSGEPKVTVRGPKGGEEPVKQLSAQDGVFSYEYHPNSIGKHSVSITWGGQHIPKR